MIDQPLSPVAKEEDEVRRADGAIAVEVNSRTRPPVGEEGEEVGDADDPPTLGTAKCPL